MKKGRKYNRKEIEKIAKSAIGKSFREIKEKEKITISEGSLKKGGLGQLVEKGLYGIESNNKSEPDFMPAGIELKVTPYRKIKNNKLSAKERLVLNIIDYNEEYKNEFKKSHFWFKNNKIQLLWYLYEEEKEKLDYKITHQKLIELSLNEDLEQIEKDWNNIINKIKEGKAHEISEADTMYLGACPKGANESSKRTQPFSSEKAMQRAFCFKSSYMTALVRKYIGNHKDVEKVLKETKDMNQFINNVVNKYKNKTKSELMKELNVKTNAKNVLSMIINRMFNVKSNLKETDEFLKANIIPKTIRIQKTGRIKESMSYPSFDFEEIVNTPFSDSDIKEELETTKYMFFVFKEIEKEEYAFKGIKLWNMPKSIIDSKVKDVYEKTQEIIKEGNIVNHIDKKGRRITNFPGMRYNGVFHVRPHGNNAKDTKPIPERDKVTKSNKYTKQCFWINNNYLKEILKEFIE